MDIYYTIVMFVFGTIFGSFYNVVGDRMPDGKSIVKPGSHCPKCSHVLTPIELIPVLSYIIQGGKCKNCKCKVPLFHPLYELFVGILFASCYLIFGFTGELIVALTFVSMLAILIVSDYYYMIILDEVLIFFGILLFTEVIFFNGLNAFFIAVFNGFIAFLFMYGLKIFGDLIFKRESMGGGDIKLLFFFGFVLTWQMALFSIFLGSLIGLPVSLLVLKLKKTHIIPFGPFLSVGAIIILFTHFNIDKLLSILLS
jgi:leader peptidase (prepilin peptidase)/N-methyltransferase